MTTSQHPRHGVASPAGRVSRACRNALGAIVMAGAVTAAACGRPTTPARAAVAVSPAKSPPTATPKAKPPLSEAEIRDLDLAFYQERAHRDPTGALDLAHVGALYLARGRETGDPRDALQAEAAARRSLHNRPERNLQAAQILESSLMAQHRFAEALQLARAARAAEPENPVLRATVGEIQMELGQYDSARVAFADLRMTPGDLAIPPRLARWAEIEGQPERARALLHATLVGALRTPGMPREQLAWYWLRVGDVEMRTGHPRAADSAYQAGLAVHPRDYRLLSALAHSAALQQHWRAAVDYGEQTIGETLDPAALGVLSDAYAALGDTAKGAEYAHVLDVAVLRQPGAYHRAWSLFLLDHDRHRAIVARKIREELRTRHDVYAYDLLAWSLHKQGRDAEAATAMTSALREGTQDAQLFYHAGMIERALGHADAARQHLERALATNPYFGPTQPAEARAALAALRAPNATGDAGTVVSVAGPR